MHQIISVLELIRFDLQFVKKAIQFPTDVCYNAFNQNDNEVLL